MRHEHARYSTSEGEQQAFRQELTNNPAAACSERQSNGKLPAAMSPARKKQICHIRAGDQQYEADAGQ